VRLLESVQTPGKIVSLPFEWPDSNWQSEVRTRYERESQVVTQQRLASEYDGSGHNYAAEECVDVCSLI
jgi:hypothetical protein